MSNSTRSIWPMQVGAGLCVFNRIRVRTRYLKAHLHVADPDHVSIVKFLLNHDSDPVYKRAIPAAVIEQVDVPLVIEAQPRVKPGDFRMGQNQIAPGMP